MSTNKEVTLRALQNMRGDDLERAEIAFFGRTREGMAKEYGQSGKTCQAILDEYSAERARIDAAIAWVKSL